MIPLSERPAIQRIFEIAKSLRYYNANCHPITKSMFYILRIYITKETANFLQRLISPVKKVMA